jgi:ABC-2 type transport system permease protein
MAIAVLDQDRSFFSLEVKDQLRRDGQFAVVEVDSEETIRRWLRTGEARLGLVIPKGFEERLTQYDSSVFPLFIDGTMPTLAQAGMVGASVLTSDEAAEGLTFVEDPAKPAPLVRKRPVKIEQNVLFNPELRDSDFFLPGTIGIVIMLVVLTLSAGLVREKEQATIEQLLVTPISRLALIAGKMIPYGVIAWLDFVVVSLLARLVFDLPFRSSLVALGALALLFILALLALGALISTMSETQLQANFMAVFVIVPSVLMSGFVFPIDAIPLWLQPVAWSLPMTYFMEAIRGLTLKGTTALDHSRDFAALAAFLVAFTGLSLLRFRKQIG